MFLGLRTVIYPAPDLAASKAWYTALLGVEPYFDEPFYVGFDVGGYELGLNPDNEVAETYWASRRSRRRTRACSRRARLRGRR
jgi:catechol 2,3-dioxygenase-like lactoylglutathione lyase family enzyme